MTEIVLADIRARIATLREAQPPFTYDDIGDALGINKGVAWKLHNQPDYLPELDTLHKLGIRKDPRTRHRVNVDAETHARIKAEAERDGVSMGEVVKNRFVSR